MSNRKKYISNSKNLKLDFFYDPEFISKDKLFTINLKAIKRYNQEIDKFYNHKKKSSKNEINGYKNTKQITILLL